MMRIAIVAGEASGDVLGGSLIQELKLKFPDARFAGIGGSCMQRAGLHSWWPIECLSVMGIIEVLRHLPKLLKIRHKLIHQLLDWQPDLFIGIDAPDFNFTVARRLKSHGILTVHYVSPSIWAWREKRITKISRSTDLMLCLFPMEPAIYARYGIAAHFVGHPLADQLTNLPSRQMVRQKLQLPEQEIIIALLPGSRISEVERLTVTFIESLLHVVEHVEHITVLVPLINQATLHVFLSLLAPYIQHTIHEKQSYKLKTPQGKCILLHITHENSHESMLAANIVLLASGTATLEAMLLRRPMVVAYKISPWTYWLVRSFNLLKSKYYALPNVLANQLLVPELMQNDCQPEKLAKALITCLSQEENQHALQQNFASIHQSLQKNASCSAASAIAELIVKKRP